MSQLVSQESLQGYKDLYGEYRKYSETNVPNPPTEGILQAIDTSGSTPPMDLENLRLMSTMMESLVTMSQTMKMEDLTKMRPQIKVKTKKGKKGRR